MATHRQNYRGCAIVVETEKADHPMLYGVLRVGSVLITRDGVDMGYPPPKYESQDESKMVDEAIANAKLYIQARFSE